MPKHRKLALSEKIYAQLYERYHNDMEGFARDLFFSPGFDDWQREISEKFYDDVKHLFFARASGHGTGKSYFAAIAALHFLLFNDDVGIVVTSNTRAQLINKFGRELAYQVNKGLLTEYFEVTATKVYRKLFNGKTDQTAFIELATNNPTNVEAFSGLHPKNILMIADECSGLDPGIHQAILSSTPKNVPGAKRRLLYFGNPLRASGVFYDIFHNPKIKKNWDTGHLNALECRYSDKEYCQLLIDSYGEKSNQVRTRVYGLFPTTGADALISSDAIDAAVTRELEPYLYRAEPIIMGVDCARKGDDLSVIIKRQGGYVYPDIVTIEENTVTELARRVFEVYNNTTPRPAKIVVDAIGIGAGVYDILNEWKLPVVEFIASQAAYDTKRYNNLRTETYFELKELIENGKCKLPDNPVLLDDLRALTYDYNKRLQLRVVGKDVIKPELGRSTDLGDAVMLTMHDRLDVRHRRQAKPRAVVETAWAW